jgi:hypothetical protein
MFELLDDGDGSLTLEEFIKVCTAVRLKTAQPALQHTCCVAVTQHAQTSSAQITKAHRSALLQTPEAVVRHAEWSVSSSCHCVQLPNTHLLQAAQVAC